MDDLVIIGAGDFGREVAYLVKRINCNSQTWNVLGFVDDGLVGSIIDGYPVLGNIEWLNNYNKPVFAVCSIGHAVIRERVISKVQNTNIQWATLIDPDAHVYDGAQVDEGTIVCEGSVIAIKASLGRHVIVNINSTVGHDTIIGCCSVINPGVNISGKVYVGEKVDIGSGSVVIQGLKIGHNSVIGAGGVVVKDVPDNCTAVGVPVKVIKWNEA